MTSNLNNAFYQIGMSTFAKACNNKLKQQQTKSEIFKFGKIFSGFVSSNYSWHFLGLGKTNSLFRLASKEIFGIVILMHFIRTDFLGRNGSDNIIVGATVEGSSEKNSLQCLLDVLLDFYFLQ